MKVYLLILIFVITNSFAQLTQSFTQIAKYEHNNYGGMAVAIGPDGTVFSAGSWSGLWAFEYDRNFFINTAHINDGGTATDVAVGPDGTIFLANGEDGIRAYTYDGSSFTNTAHRYDGGSAQGVTVSTDGVVFLASMKVLSQGQTLIAYSYNGSAFSKTAYKNDGDWGLDVTVGPDGTLFLANGFEGLRAYSFDGNSFTNTAQINGAGDGSATGVTVSVDGTVFLANTTTGNITHKVETLIAYNYDDSSFTKIDSVIDGDYGTNIAVSSDSTVFLANGFDGLWAYEYDGSSFTKTAQNDDGGFYVSAGGVAVDSNGTVFLANGWEGLRAYNYDGSSFTRAGHYTDVGGVDYLALGSDNTIFSLNGHDGLLRAYKYNGQSFTSAGHQSGWDTRDLVIKSDSLVFTCGGALRAIKYDGISFSEIAHHDVWANCILNDSNGTLFLIGDSLHAFSFADSLFSKIAQIDLPGYSWVSAIGTDGTIFLSGDSLRAYSITDSSFSCNAVVDVPDNGWWGADALTLGPDGTVFLAYGEDGLHAYSYDGNSFTNTAHIDDGGYASGLDVGFNGTVFLANGDDGLRAYNYNGNSFTNIAHLNDVTESFSEVRIGTDGTVFIGGNDLYAYSYSGYTGLEEKYSPLPVDFYLAQNYPNPFNPKTIINYQLPVSSKLDISIYNIIGQKMATLINKNQPAGSYQVQWDGTRFSSGVYFYRLQTENGFIKTRKLVLLK